jgi:hypothetical protein
MRVRLLVMLPLMLLFVLANIAPAHGHGTVYATIAQRPICYGGGCGIGEGMWGEAAWNSSLCCPHTTSITTILQQRTPGTTTWSEVERGFDFCSSCTQKGTDTYDGAGPDAIYSCAKDYRTKIVADSTNHHSQDVSTVLPHAC